MDDNLQMPTICVLLNVLPLAARPATSSLYRYAEGTIANSIVMVMKLHGGAMRKLTRWQPHARYGSKRIPYRQIQTRTPP